LFHRSEAGALAQGDPRLTIPAMLAAGCVHADPSHPIPVVVPVR
jgi:hypothetical protein